MDVKVDVSENVRFQKKISVIGVATDNGHYKKNICLEPRTKKRIAKYKSHIGKIHCILIFDLIKEEIQKYNSIQFCTDIGKRELMNRLRHLFKGNKYWKRLEKNKKIKVIPVKKAYVDKYVKQVRTNPHLKEKELKLKDLKLYLKKFEKKK